MTHAFRFVCRQIVHDDDVARRQGWNENLLDIGLNATPFIAPSKTMGALIPDSLSAPVNVVVSNGRAGPVSGIDLRKGPVREAETYSCSVRFYR